MDRAFESRIDCVSLVCTVVTIVFFYLYRTNGELHNIHRGGGIVVTKINIDCAVIKIVPDAPPISNWLITQTIQWIMNNDNQKSKREDVS